MRYLLGYW